MTDAGVTVTGLDEVLEKLDSLDKKLGGSVARKALRAGVNKIKSEAESRAPKGPTGNLKKGFKIRSKTRKWGYEVQLINNAPHAWLVENGFWLTKRSKLGVYKRIKFVTGNPFLITSMDSRFTDVVETVADGMRNELNALGSSK